MIDEGLSTTSVARIGNRSEEFIFSLLINNITKFSALHHTKQREGFYHFIATMALYLFFTSMERAHIHKANQILLLVISFATIMILYYFLVLIIRACSFEHLANYS